MKIALLGYGQMGKAIEKIALNRGHEIVLIVDSKTINYDVSIADIAIDFSIPSSAEVNIIKCFNNNVPVISGTTGWHNRIEEITELCIQKKGAFITATNFSLGVHIFFELNEQLAKMMSNLNNYNISIEEIHHTKKLDAPSGTAITLAEGIIKHTKKNNWSLDVTNDQKTLPITAKRIPEVTGTHTISYSSEIDTININHTAHNREGFALGAVVAAAWLVDKKGVYTMKDVLGI